MADGSWPVHPSGKPIYAGAPGKLKVVGFAGGGGSSVAVKEALNVAPDLAMNHWMVAVLAHQRHFPETEHLCTDIWERDPRTWRPGERIAFGWFSPDCTDFSKAKGKAPRSERIRGLAWSILPWAVFRMVDTIMVENVEEFIKWGPVYRSGPKAGEPIPERRGETFRRWVRRMNHIGYVVEWRVLNAADYGAPTTRKRLYLICKYVGVPRLLEIQSGREASPVVWPEPSHAPRHLAEKLGRLPWVGACEIIDWNERCPSIFLTQAEAKAEGVKVKRPLVAATHSRVARGLEKFVIGSAEPYIVPITQRTWGADRTHGSGSPMPTVLGASGGQHAVVDVAMTVGVAHGEHAERPGTRSRDLRDPVHTISGGGGDAAAVSAAVVGVGGRRGFSPPTSTRRPFPTVTGKADAALAAGYLVPRYGEREGQAPRALPITGPYPAVVPDQNGGSLVAAHLHQMNTRDVGQELEDPARTGAARSHQAVQVAWLGRQFGSTVSGRLMVEPTPTIMTEGGGGKSQALTAFMAQGNFEYLGRSAKAPITTLTGRSTQQQLVSAHLGSYYGVGTGSQGSDPMRAATGKDRHALTLAHMAQANTGMTGHPMTAPVSTIVELGSTQQLIETALALEGGPVGRRGQVLAFLWEHFGVPTEAEWLDPAGTLQGRLKFGLVVLDGLVWMIVDIGLRMLKPSELAAAMGLPPEYDLETNAAGLPVSKTDQIQMIGNMVSPPPAIAMIRANCPELIEPQDWKEAA